MTRWIKRLLLAIFGLILVAVGLLYRGDIQPQMLRQKYASTDSEFITVEPGLAVHVRDQGPQQAPVIVLLHGSNSSLQTWEPWVGRLTDTYRVITMDLPGHGLTGPHPRDVYAVTDMVAVVDAVMRHKKIGKFILGGNSMGGWVTWHFALEHPEKLSGMILVDAFGAPLKDEARRQLPIGFRLAMMPVIKDVATNLTPRFMIAQSVHQTVAVQSSVTPAIVDRYWELLRYPGNRRATVLRFAASRLDGSFTKLRGIQVPALIQWGREDKLIPVDSVGAFKAMLPNSEAIIYEGVGHLPMEEIPARSVADARSWLARLAPPAPATK
jgi:pimeloyl-ACP methyl ester carboxylesterase